MFGRNRQHFSFIQKEESLKQGSFVLCEYTWCMLCLSSAPSYAIHYCIWLHFVWRLREMEAMCKCMMCMCQLQFAYEWIGILQRYQDLKLNLTYSNLGYPEHWFSERASCHMYGTRASQTLWRRYNKCMVLIHRWLCRLSWQNGLSEHMQVALFPSMFR